MREAFAENQIDDTVARTHRCEAVWSTVHAICCSRCLRWTDAQLSV